MKYCLQKSRLSKSLTAKPAFTSWGDALVFFRKNSWLSRSLHKLDQFVIWIWLQLWRESQYHLLQKWRSVTLLKKPSLSNLWLIIQQMSPTMITKTDKTIWTRYKFDSLMSTYDCPPAAGVPPDFFRINYIFVVNLGVGTPKNNYRVICKCWGNRGNT